MDNHTNHNLEYKLRYMHSLETKINTVLGYRYWKSYVNSAFWSQVSMPINLTITILTALTTAQAASPSIFSNETYIKISIGTLMLTTLNTFFKPYDQMTQSISIMKKWFDLGCSFENIFYSDNKGISNIENRISSYEVLMKTITDLNRSETPYSQNFVSDLIFIILMSNTLCLKNKTDWLALDCSLRETSIDEISDIEAPLDVNTLYNSQDNIQPQNNIVPQNNIPSQKNNLPQDTITLQDNILIVPV